MSFYLLLTSMRAADKLIIVNNIVDNHADRNVGHNVNISVAVLGLGEAGSAIAEDLIRAGVRVRGWDPAPKGELNLESIPLAESDHTAVAGADVVLSVNTASVATKVAERVAPLLNSDQLYADLNTASPQLKAVVARTVEGVGASFVDLALMAPVAGLGIRTPCLASGSGAAKFVEMFRPLGMPVRLVDARAGSAAERKLLRSVFMKGVAAAVIEGVEAASAAGCSGWLREEIISVFEEADSRLFERLIDGSYRHANRRVDEMMAAGDLLRALGVEPRVTVAAAGWLEELATRSSTLAKGDDA
jgi:3-hydroxyisobutyrate dehydrogenase-like beta-hydroxyacid dehydrogenase